MNKIVSINIGGIAISIEEDAYDVLRDYLKNISNHFANTENGEEIVSDIELRIAEVLQGKLTTGKVSINTTDVKEVAEAMGYPSDFDDEETTKTTTEDDKGEESQESQEEPSTTRKARRRLFRDVDDQKVGGVCSGLARYFDLDVTLLRILWVVSLLVFGFGLWLYIILWAVLPEAKTTAEKLEMMGEAPNIENIKNTIHKEASSAYNRITSPENRRTVSRFFEGVIKFMSKLFGGFFKVFALAAFVGIIVLLITMFMAFLFDGNRFHIGSEHINEQMFELVIGGQGAMVFKIALYLICAIPLVYLAMKILPQILSIPKPTKPVRQGVLSAWFLAIIAAAMGFFYSVYQFRDEGYSRITKDLNVTSDTLVIKIDDLIGDDYSTDGTRIKLDVVQQTEEQFQLDVRKTARARNEKAAMASLDYIVDSYKLTNNILLLSENVLVKDDGKISVPNMELTIRLPIGKTVIFHESTKRVISDIRNLQNIYDPRMAGHTFLMTHAGLKCVDCNVQDKSSNMSSDNDQAGFHKIVIGGALSVEIIEGESQRIVIPKEDNFDERIKIDIRNNRLRLRQKSGTMFHSNGKKTIKVYLPNLKAIKAEGASKVLYKSSRKTKDYFDLVVEGTAHVEVVNVETSKLAIDLEGAGSAEISGRGDLLILEMSGASSFDASDFEVKHINVELEGASKAKVHATKELKGDVTGVSVITYRGAPNLDIETTAAAKIKPMN